LTFHIHHGLYLFLCTLLFFGCANEPQDGLPPHVAAIDSLIVLADEGSRTESVTLQSVAVFQDSLFMNDIQSVATDQNGNVYAAGESWNRRKVFRFDASGTLIDSLGNRGSDFGEFEQISRLQFRDDLLYIFDDELNRVTTYDTVRHAFQDTLSISLNPNLIADDWDGASVKTVAAVDEWAFIIALHKERDPAYDPVGAVRYFRSEGESGSDELPLFSTPDLRYMVGDYAGRPAEFTITISERPLTEVSPNNRIYSAYSDEFLIHVRDEKGEHLHSYYRNSERELLDPIEEILPRFSHNDQLLRVRESAQYPKKWPALYSLLPDDENRVWISTVTEDRNYLEWWVIDDHTGELSARFTWPFSKPIVHIRNGLIYTIEQDDMGFKIVKAYRMMSSDEENQPDV